MVFEHKSRLERYQGLKICDLCGDENPPRQYLIVDIFHADTAKVVCGSCVTAIRLENERDLPPDQKQHEFYSDGNYNVVETTARHFESDERPTYQLAESTEVIPSEDKES